jgi:prophage regulatory protein
VSVSASLRFLRLPDVERVAGIRRSTIYKLEGEGKFPRRVSLPGGRAVAWIEAEVQTWMAACIARRDALTA